MREVRFRLRTAGLKSADNCEAANSCGSAAAGHVFRLVWAEIDQHANAAQRFAGHADIPAMQDKPVMSVEQKPIRDDAHKSIFDLARRFARRDGEAVGDAEDKGVDSQRRLAEDGVEHHIRGLAANPGQGLQLLAVARRLAAVPFDDRARERDEVLGLRPIKADRLDQSVTARRRAPPSSPACRRWRTARASLCSPPRRSPAPTAPPPRAGEGVDVFEFALRGGIGGGQALEDRLGPRRLRLPGLSSRHRRFIGARGGRAKRGLD